jgi:succinoglycan biosynthesis protein ExoU
LKVAVIIAGYNAEKTIARAIRSALAQNEVAEVMVVDDASTDRTLEVAKSCDDGTGRLIVLAQPFNQGPAAARNRGIKASTSPFISILDSDDVILDGRFADLLQTEDWDFIADDIAFVSEKLSLNEALPQIRRQPAPLETLELAQFVLGSIPRKGHFGRELGFLKPIIRRTFLQEKDIYFAETMRLSEDYELYCRLMIAGGRFKIFSKCGYLAFEREGSLSSVHSVHDLEQILEANAQLLANPSLTAPQREAISRHQAYHRDKTNYRKILELKKAQGYSKALAWIVRNPDALASTLKFWLTDKMRDLGSDQAPKSESGILRYLLTDI